MDDEIHVIVTMGHIGHIAVVLFDKLSLPVDEKTSILIGFIHIFADTVAIQDAPHLLQKT